jgi:hypothetical protein
VEDEASCEMRPHSPGTPPRAQPDFMSVDLGEVWSPRPAPCESRTDLVSTAVQQDGVDIALELSVHPCDQLNGLEFGEWSEPLTGRCPRCIRAERAEPSVDESRYGLESGNFRQEAFMSPTLASRN